MPESTRKKLTYLLGAGASANSLPILNELNERMILLASLYFETRSPTGESIIPKESFFIDHYHTDNYIDDLIWQIGYFGFKGRAFGTIDTYAKKLSFNSASELNKLKTAVSTFFTIWQLSEDHTLRDKSRMNITSQIDPRYIALLSSILKKSDQTIYVDSNVKFVSWNYDLQVQMAFKEFHPETYEWEDLFRDLRFQPNRHGTDLNLCHLNGYCAFYNTSGNENHVLDRTEKKDFKSVINNIGFLNESSRKGQIEISNHINYAWEKNSLADQTRAAALSIFRETDILVVIGYSFPSFNKEIDKELFAVLPNHCKIYYQDPKAVMSKIQKLAPHLPNSNCSHLPDVTQFDLPYEY